MLKVLDKYILKKYLFSYIYITLLIVIVICVIDYTEKNDAFISRQAPLDEIFIDYYLNFFVHIANMIAPVFVFISTVFVTAKLASRTEIVAILSSGVSFKRFLLPFFIGSCIISALIFYLKSYVIPNANKIRMNFENTYVWPKFNYEKRNIHMKVAQNSYIYMESYNNNIHAGYQFTLETISDSNLVSKITANEFLGCQTKKNGKLNIGKSKFLMVKKNIFLKVNLWTLH